MRVPDGYVLKSPIRRTARSEVHLAVRETDGAEVVLKAYRGDSGAGRRARRSELEWDALRAAGGPGVPAAIALLVDATPPVLVLERVPGIPLDVWVASNPPPVAELLEVAAQLARVLARIHAVRLIHRDLTPHNVIVDAPGRIVTLTDFGSARSLGAHTGHGDPAAGSSDTVGQLHYAAPEQSGRMNRGIDARSDLYSLGATLYFAATGRTPFDLDDPLALLHAHMAVRPTPPSVTRPDLPEAISRLILKLLEKEPDDRYQSAAALLADLKACQRQLDESGRIDPDLVLGTAEIPSRPRFPRRVYGRESELVHLRRCYSRAAAGRPQVLLLGGDSGMGKSSLVEALRPEVAGNGGYLAVGKFDVSSDRPCRGWTSALEAYVEQRLIEPDERLRTWREALRAGLGGIAQAAVDLIPALTWVLGDDVPAMPVLGPREAEARLALALLRFVEVSATPEHPLVIFLDDLQWSDAASRALLEALLGSISSSAVLLVGAYRANEVREGHPLLALLERLPQRAIAFERIELGPCRRRPWLPC